MLFLSGCSAVWLARLTGGQKVASSTLAIPTIFYAKISLKSTVFGPFDLMLQKGAKTCHFEEKSRQNPDIFPT